MIKDGHGDDGISLRDYFASRVDVSLYSPLLTLERKLGRSPTIDELANYITQVRYIEADAMLRRRDEHE